MIIYGVEKKRRRKRVKFEIKKINHEPLTRDVGGLFLI